MTKRIVLFVLFAAVGFGVLALETRDWKGQTGHRVSPHLGKTRAVEPGIDLSDLTSEAPRILVSEGRDVTFGDHGPWTWKDDEGPPVVIANLRLWWFRAQRIASQDDGSIRFIDVEVLRYREPRTRREAEAVAAGDPAALDALTDARISASEASAHRLAERFQAKGESRTGGGVVHLRGDVTLHAPGEGVTVTGSDLTLDLERNVATGEGVFRASHEAYEVQGTGLRLAHDDGRGARRLDMLRDVRATVRGGLDGLPPGANAGREPLRIESAGGATLWQSQGVGEEDRLHIELREQVRGEQMGAWRLEADAANVIAARRMRGDAKDSQWEVLRFEAEGNVEGTLMEGERQEPYRITMTATRLVREAPLHGEGAAVIALQGHPRIVMRGSIPFAGILDEGTLLEISSQEEAWLGPPAPADVPEGVDARTLRRIVLRGAARIERLEAPPEGEQDILEADRMSLLLHTDGTDPLEGGSARVLSAGALGDVRLSGTRMAGRTQRLVIEGLDTEMPRLTAQGRGTDFQFRVARGQRLLGTDDETHDAGGPADPREPRRELVLDRLRAHGSVEVSTSAGGPAIGLETHLEGHDLAYDRIEDRARVRGSPARVTLGPRAGQAHSLEAPTIGFERGRGLLTAGDGARARILVTDGGGGDLDAVLPEPVREAAASLRVRTEGRIEIAVHRTGVEGMELRPGAEQVVRIEGGVVAEVTSERAVDRLRADRVEVALVHEEVTQAPEAPWVPTAKAGSRRNDASPSARRGGKAPAPQVWDLTSTRLRLAFADGRVSSFDAHGKVVLDGDGNSVRGDRLSYDADGGVVQVTGTRERGAEAWFRARDERHRVVSPTLAIDLVDGKPRRVRTGAPAFASLVLPDEKASGALERMEIASRGPVLVTADDVRAEGWVEVRHRERATPGAEWRVSGILWSESIVLTGKDLLAHPSSDDVLRIVAQGPRTTLQMGEGEEMTRVWGDRFELDVRAGTVTVTGTPARHVIAQRGPPERPTMSADQEKAVFDYGTRELVDWAGPRVVVPR